MSARFFTVTLALCAGLTLLAQGARIKSQEALSRAAKQQAPGKAPVNCQSTDEQIINGCNMATTCGNELERKLEEISRARLGDLTAEKLSLNDGCCWTSCPGSPKCSTACLSQMNTKKDELVLGGAIRIFRVELTKLTDTVENVPQAATQALRAAFAVAGAHLDASNDKMQEAHNLILGEENKARRKLSEAIRNPNRDAFEQAISDGENAGLPAEELKNFRDILTARKKFKGAFPDDFAAAIGQLPKFPIGEGKTFGPAYDNDFQKALDILDINKAEHRRKLNDLVASDGPAEDLRTAIAAGRQAGLSQQELDEAEALAKKLEDEAAAKRKAEQEEEEARVAAEAAARNIAGEQEPVTVPAQAMAAGKRSKVVETTITFGTSRGIKDCTDFCKDNIKSQCEEARGNGMQQEVLCFNACRKGQTTFKFKGCAGSA